jgi:hypothetical protein
VRLTLRTLLAYLDDTLGANEIKGIGEKVAESDAAQELIARIKQVTRRRRLTTPPASGPEAFDPNDVAEYLDNELEGDRIAKVEKQCLESDVHLAEIAACHQILTLVLGEPALVPPKAKERMYKLVTSRESIPFRKAAPARKANPDGLDDEEELELGGGWLRWVLPAAGILLVIALSVAVYSILQKPTRPDPHAGNTRDKDRNKDGEKPKDADVPLKDKDKDGSAVVAKDGGKDGPAKDDGGKDKPLEKDVSPKDDGKGRPPENPGVVPRTAPPNPKRAEIGSYRGGMTDIPTVLVRRTADGWQAVQEGAVVHSSDTLTALPGFTSLVGTRGGVGLTLRGHIPSFSISPRMNLLLESSVILHQSDAFDLDMTLVRGRVYVRNTKPKGPARVRIRFEKEVWDLTLTLPGDEAGFDLFKEYSAPIDHLTEPPHASLVLFMLSGDAQLNVDAFHTHALEAAGDQSMILLWDGFRKTGTPQRMKMLTEFSKTPPSPEQVEGPTRKAELRDTVAGLKNLQTLIDGKRDKVIVALRETLGGEKPSSRVLAIYCLACLDEPDKLVDVLGDEQQEHALDRLVAIYALRHWLAATQDQYKRLFDKDKESGILIERKYKVTEAKMVTDLLFDISPEYYSKPETFEGLNRCLPHRRIAIAELGMWHLSKLALGTKLPPGFNAARPVEDREKYSERINDMILKRLLPPAPMSLPPKD